MFRSRQELKEYNYSKEELAKFAYAKITTDKGIIWIKLFNEETPNTVANFATLANDGFYNGLNFHRVIKENNSSNIYHHFGIYLYKYSALKKFVNFEKSKNEIKERLEQLRAIDNNIKINVILAKYFSSGIDTKKDLEDYIKSFKK